MVITFIHLADTFIHLEMDQMLLKKIHLEPFLEVGHAWTYLALVELCWSFHQQGTHQEKVRETDFVPP